MHKINNEIFWTGYVDWDLRNFHGYSTLVGSTYNAYLILDKFPTLIDTVKHYGFDEMLAGIKAIIDPKEIKYIISNHSEMDHSGSIFKLLEHCPEAEIVCSPKGEEHLKMHFLVDGANDKSNFKFKVVKNTDTLNIGKRTLSFFHTPMVHWPDNMVTYCAFDKILFSNDAFGQHYASAERFADELSLDQVFFEAAKYYGNIVLPFGSQVLKALEALGTLPIDMICPSHGLIWRRKEDIEKLLSFYKKWANHETDNKVLIVYDTMWHSTEAIAKKFYQVLEGQDVCVKLVNLQQAHISDIVTDLLFSKVLLLGSPILNNRMLPTVASFLMYIKGLKPKNRYALSFGSYGWATVGFKELEESLKDAGLELISEGVYSKFLPGKDVFLKVTESCEQIKKVLN